MTRSLIGLLVVSLTAGLVISLLQGVIPRNLAAGLYVLTMGLMPFVFSLALTGAVAGLHRLIRQRPLPHFRLVLWSTWALGNLLFLLDQHMAHKLG